MRKTVSNRHTHNDNKESMTCGKATATLMGMVLLASVALCNDAGLAQHAVQVTSRTPDTNIWMGASRTDTDTWPLLKVFNQATLVTNGGEVPFGMTSNGVPLAATFTLTNEGGSSLTLTSTPPIIVTGVYADAFTVMGLSTTVLGPGEAARFTLRFDQPTLSNNGAANIQVVILSSPGQPSPYTFTVTASWLNARPSGPTALWASDGGYTDRVVLSWARDPFATSYIIFRSTNGNLAWPPLADNITATNYTDVTGLSGVLYHYWLFSRNGYDYSESGAEDSGFVRLWLPANLSATDGAATNWIDLSWDPVPRATIYCIYRGIAETKAYQFVGTSPTNGYKDVFSPGGAQPGVVYSYVVSASNSVCESALSARDTGYGALMAPVVDASDGSCTGFVRVAWDPVWGAQSYRIYRHTAPDFDKASNIAAVVASPYNDADVIVGTGYYYWIESVSPPSVALSVCDRGFVVHVAGYEPSAIWTLKKRGNLQTLEGKDIPDVVEAFLSNNWQIGISGYNTASDTCRNYFGPLSLTLKKMKLKDGVPVRWWWETKVKGVISIKVICQYGRFGGVQRWMRNMKLNIVPKALGDVPDPCIVWMIPPGSPRPTKVRMEAGGLVPDEFVGIVLQPLEPVGTEDVQYLVPTFVDTRTSVPADKPKPRDAQQR